MTEDKIKLEAQFAYDIAKEKGLINNLDGSVGFKAGWEAAVKLFAIPVVSGSFNCTNCNDGESLPPNTKCLNCGMCHIVK